MRRVHTTLGLLSALISMSGAAAAQELGNQGDLSFAGERLTGLYYQDVASADGVVLGLAAPPMGGGWSGGAWPHAMPRVGIDYFVINRLSIGGSLGLFTLDSEFRGGNDFVGFMLAPRVGYTITFGSGFGFWPRGGLTIFNFDGYDGLLLSGEGAFYAIVGERWGFQFGPNFDITIAGDRPKALSIGLVTAGVFGYL
jgi:hypothetical protein